jgi:galactonate dehydratase
VKIASVKCWPLTTSVGDDQQRTSQGSFGTISIILVEVTTDEGIVGWGEGLARYAPKAYAELVHGLLAPVLLGEDPFHVERLWQKMFRVFTGKAGGVLIEALAAVDIALWDIMGKALGQPVHRLLGGMGRSHVAAYASSIAWASDEVAVEQTRKALAQGFRLIKVKIGAPVEKAIARCRLVRETVGDAAKVCADANWIFDVDEALVLGRAMHELGYFWLEEPIVPEDVAGYRRLREKLDIRLAAGESEHHAFGARDLIASRAVGVIQPDVARSGGFTETRRIAYLAHAFHVAYAPHVGASGAVCAAASLHLAAAMPNFLTFECMTFENPLRLRLTKEVPGDPDALVDGMAAVPQGPGLGIEVDRDAVENFLAR